jgi:hypothetical protein
MKVKECSSVQMSDRADRVHAVIESFFFFASHARRFTHSDIHTVKHDT